MSTFWETAAQVWQNLPYLLRTRRDRTPIDTVAALETFVSTRSVYIAQKTLYGYVKTRMGTRYVAMFNDANIVASINIAKMHVFAACLSDLTVYAVATALPDAANDGRRRLARQIYAAGLRENTAEAPEPFSAKDCIDEFEHRLNDTDWQQRARQAYNFTLSPKALYRWAPIVDRLKNFDREIVESSVIYGWRDIREQFNKRLNAEAVSADWARLGGRIGDGAAGA